MSDVFDEDSKWQRKLWGDVAFEAFERAWKRGMRGVSPKELEPIIAEVKAEWRAAGKLERPKDGAL